MTGLLLLNDTIFPPVRAKVTLARTLEALDKMSITDIQRFFDQHYKGKTFNYAVIGSTEKVKKEGLQKYGNLIDVSPEDIFGY